MAERREAGRLEQAEREAALDGHGVVLQKAPGLKTEDLADGERAA